jgi:TRAP-type C4-dicarboxylate transport system substrate-binding protein
MKAALRSLALFAALGTSAALADPVQIRFASPAPPMSQVNTWGLVPWTEEVQKASNGAVEFKFFAGPSLGTFNNIMDRTVTQVVDASFGTFGPMGDHFKKTSVSELPFEGENCTEASIALWRLIASGLIADEFTHIKPLAVFTFPPGGYHTKKAIRTADDLKGLKIATFTRVASDQANLLGAVPVTMTPSDAYQAVQRGLASAISVGWTAFMPFKYYEVTSFHLDAQQGQGGAYVVMNKDVYAKLPADARKAIDGLSYEPFTRRMGQNSDKMEAEFRGAVSHMPGHTVEKLAPAEAATWKRILAPITEEWVKSTPNGAAVLAAYRSEIANVRAGK